MNDQKMTKDRRLLYEFWDSIPALKFVDVKKNIYGKQPIRRAIIRILREGIKGESEDDPSRKRRALNVNEIETLLKKYFEKEENKEEKVQITRTKLYFHLNLLEEAGMIQVVTSILEGPHKRNKTKYYGRTARSLFITDEEMSLNKYKTRFEEFGKFARLLEIPLPDNYSELPEKIIQYDRKRYTKLAHWLARYDSIIDQNNVNVSEIYEFIKYIEAVDPGKNKALKELYENCQNAFEKI
jgi:hypothetical protein